MTVVIYLDQLHWIELLKASIDTSKNAPARVLQMLRDGTQAKRHVCALSASHYMETWHRRRADSRHALAALMRDLSNYTTLAPIQSIQEKETEQLVLRMNATNGHLRALSMVDRECIIGHGVDHAFDSSTGRLRVVKSIATNEQPEGDAVEASIQLLDQLAKLKALPNEAYEWWSLAGSSELPGSDSFELHTQERRGQSFADNERKFAVELANRGVNGGEKLKRFVLHREWQNAEDDICRLAEAHRCLAPSPESWRQMETLIRAMPTRDVEYQISLAKHRNRQLKWEAHDLADIAALAVAVPYADAVFTEPRWADLIRRSSLDKRYNTLVSGRLSDLEKAIDDGWRVH
jgi:hypothetical protein